MWKIPDYLNVVKNIKRYIMIKKLEKYKSNSNNTFLMALIDVLIILGIIAEFYYVYFVNDNHNLKVFGGFFTVFLIAFYIARITLYVINHEKKYTGINKLVLIDGKGTCTTEWEIRGKKSLLLGKQTVNNEVDIDLSSTEYSSLISKQHAIMNFAANNWFIEDIGSCNGVGIKRASDTSKMKLPQDTPYKLDSGDIIYIANTRLFVE